MASIMNGEIEFSIEIKEGLTQARLLDRTTGFAFADGPYRFDLALTDVPGRMLCTERLDRMHLEADGRSIRLSGSAQGLDVEVTWELASEPPILTEKLTVKNTRSEAVEVCRIGFGMTRALTGPEGHRLPEINEDRFVAVPFRRDLSGVNGEYRDFSARDLITLKPDWLRHCAETANGPRGEGVPAEEWGADGWVWTHGGRSLLVLKFSPEHLEYSNLSMIIACGDARAGSKAILRFGGCGQFRDDPQEVHHLAAGAVFRAGLTHYELVTGDWRAGYDAFRNFMENQGIGLHPDYNPLVHWNELYDNLYWWGGSHTAERREKFYRLEDLWAEAAKARDFGCEALYLDPGWDTLFASSIWDESRLGTQKEFVARLRRDYRFELGLHVPLAGWCDVEAYPAEARRLDENGKRLEEQLCSGSRQYLHVKRERILKLCADGARFIIYDGTVWTGPCFDPKHGHPIPYTHGMQANNYLELCHIVHEKFPEILVELHDCLTGGVYRYGCPPYFPVRKGPCDENWGYEFMWRPMRDLLWGQSISLYYYNLAYSFPLYLHVDLRLDNEHALVFWWTASTCRHLGIGGTHADERVVSAQKTAMKTYLRLKRFYTHGRFVGISEDVHAHVLPELRSAVIDIFNLSDRSVEKVIRFRPESLRLPPASEWSDTDQRIECYGPEVEYRVYLPPFGHTKLEIRPHT